MNERGAVNWLAVIAIVVLAFFLIWLLQGQLDLNWGRGK